MKKVYLAGPFFSPEQVAFIEKTAKFLREKYEVFVPMEHEIPIKAEGEAGHRLWGKEIFEMDVEAIKNADLAVVCDYGDTSDAGTAREAGFMYALGIPTYVVSASDDLHPPHSLMVVNGCTKFFSCFDDFKRYFTTNEDVRSKDILQK